VSSKGPLTQVMPSTQCLGVSKDAVYVGPSARIRCCGLSKLSRLSRSAFMDVGRRTAAAQPVRQTRNTTNLLSVIMKVYYHEDTLDSLRK